MNPILQFGNKIFGICQSRDVDLEAQLHASEASNFESSETTPLLSRRAQIAQATNSSSMAGRVSILPPSASAELNEAVNNLARSDINEHSKFSEIETYIRNIGTEDLSWQKSVQYRSPKYLVKSGEFLRDTLGILVGTGASLGIGTAIGAPIGYVFDSTLGKRIGNQFATTVDIFTTRGRPLASEYQAKWEVMRKLFEPRLEKLGADEKVVANKISNYCVHFATEWNKIDAIKENITTAELDVAKSYMTRWAFMACAASLELKPVNFADADPNAMAELQERITGLAPEQQSQVRILMQKIENGSKSTSNNISLISSFFSGPGGTGKTTLVHLLAQVTGLPLKKISLNSTSVRELRGSQESIITGRSEKSLQEIIGQVAKAIMDSGYANPIIYFDEADFKGNNAPSGKLEDQAAFFKELLQDCGAILNVRGLNMHLNARSVIWLASSNHRITDPALAQRFPEIALLGLSLTEKQLAGLKALDAELVQTAQRSGTSISARIGNIMREMMESIVEIDSQRNFGGRVIQLAVKDITACLEIKANESPSFNSNDKKAIQEIINNVYLSYPAENTMNLRLGKNERDEALKLIDDLISKSESSIKDTQSFKKLKIAVNKSMVMNNDYAMLLIVGALQEGRITSVAHQASALYLIENLAVICKRVSSNATSATTALLVVLKALTHTLENVASDPSIQLKLVHTIRDILSALDQGAVLDKACCATTIEALKRWRCAHDDASLDILRAIDLAVTHAVARSQ